MRIISGRSGTVAPAAASTSAAKQRRVAENLAIVVVAWDERLMLGWKALVDEGLMLGWKALVDEGWGLG